jgi:hypothetical protein
MHPVVSPEWRLLLGVELESRTLTDDKSHLPSKSRMYEQRNRDKLARPNAALSLALTVVRPLGTRRAAPC